MMSEAQRLQQQLDQFYEKVNSQKKGAQDAENEFIFGKRSEKEIEFIKKMEHFNKTDVSQIL